MSDNDDLHNILVDQAALATACELLRRWSYAEESTFYPPTVLNDTRAFLRDTSYVWNDIHKKLTELVQVAMRNQEELQDQLDKANARIEELESRINLPYWGGSGPG
jgi:hypothetical protein